MAEYFEPNAAPEKETTKRMIRVRFKTKEDVIEFEKKTGIKLSHKKTVRIDFPINDPFADF